MLWTPHRGVAIVGSLLRLAAIVPAAVVSAQTLTVDQASLALFAQAGGQPASRIISVGGQGNVTVSTSTAWLSVNLRGGFTPNLAMVMADPGSLPAGSYSATFSLIPLYGGATVTVPVTFTVSNGPVLQTDADSLSFVYQTGHAPPITRFLTVTSSDGAALNYSASAQTSACGNSWLSLAGGSPGTTDGVLAVLVSPAALASGTCTGSIAITATDAATGAVAAGSPLTVRVTLQVADIPLLVVDPPGPVSFTTPVTTRLQSGQGLTVSGTTSTALLDYSVLCTTANGRDGWLNSGPLQAPFVGGHDYGIGVDSAGLPAGTYRGACGVYGVNRDGTRNNPIVIPVTLSVTAGTLSVSPGALTFTVAPGSAPPAPQNVAVIGGGASVTCVAEAAAAYTGANSAPLISVSQSTGVIPGTVAVSPLTSGLASGTYQGSVRILAHGPGGAPVSGSPAVVNVTLAVAPAIEATPASLAFTYQQGAAVAAPQTLNVTTTSSVSAITVAATTQNGGLGLRRSLAQARRAPSRFQLPVKAWRLAFIGAVWRSGPPGSRPRPSSPCG